jgi:hypothetical protein
MTTTYTVTRDQIISAALRKLGVVEMGTNPTSDMISNAAQSLNIMIKAWQSSGIKLWTVYEYSIPLTATKTTYTIGPTGTTSDVIAERPLKIIQAFIRNITTTPSVDILLQPLSRQEYNTLGSKNSTGMINSWWYNPEYNRGSISFYLTPDANTATNYVVHAIGQKPLSDITLSTDIPEFPNEWMQALIWGLADEMAIEYDVPANHRQEVGLKAIKYRTELEDWDVETTSSFFTPDTRMK